MKPNRMEAFSDGVIAIIITIMVLEMKVPHGATFQDLLPVLPVFLSYLLSFIYLGIYWNNHHHMLHATHSIDGRVLWANNHLLFWLSLVPFVTGWMGENQFAAIPVALYGFVLLMAAIAYFLLQRTIAIHTENTILRESLGSDFKGKISPVLYVIGISVAFFSQIAAGVLYVVVALLWIAPDKRIEHNIHKESHKDK